MSRRLWLRLRRREVREEGDGRFLEIEPSRCRLPDCRWTMEKKKRVSVYVLRFVFALTGCCSKRGSRLDSQFQSINES